MPGLAHFFKKNIQQFNNVNVKHLNTTSSYGRMKAYLAAMLHTSFLEETHSAEQQIMLKRFAIIYNAVRYYKETL